jgi:glycosyltransferase involved in cell wall biosynthesis
MNDKVSCICITKNKRELLDKAIMCFKNQTYQNKELVILYEDDNPEQEFISSLPHHLIKIKKGKYNLGELRNIAINEATGDYITQWDDDDLHRNDRIERQMKASVDFQKPRCVLVRWLTYYKNIYSVSEKRRFWEGSLLIRKEVMEKYPNVKKFEDVPVLKSLYSKQLLKQIDEPFLYIYVYHGDNTWNDYHWRKNITRPKNLIERMQLNGMIYDKQY